MSQSKTGAKTGALRPTRIQSAARAARGLLLVADSPEGCSATDVATRLGVALPTAFHLLNTLVDEGLLAKDRRRYFLGPEAARIANGFMGLEAVAPSLLAPLRQLAETTLETAYLGVWRHGEVVVAGSIEGAHTVKVEGMHVGLAEDAHARASGKMLLAKLGSDALDAYLATHPLRQVTGHTLTQEEAFREELRVTRRRNYSIDDEEFREGVVCLGVPVEAGDIVYGTYALSIPASRLPKNRGLYLDALRTAATQAENALSVTTEGTERR